MVSCIIDKNNSHIGFPHYAQRQFGSLGLLDWDAEMKFYAEFYAGLNVIK